MLSGFRSFRFLLGAVAVAGFAFETPGQAAILALDEFQRISAAVSTPVNLTTSGSIDWAYWAPTSATGVTPPVAPTNDKFGADVISGLETIGGGSLRGSATSTTVERYSWTDGTSPATGSNASLAGLIFNSQTGSSAVGKGFQLTISGTPAEERLVTLYLGGFGATSSLIITLNGAAVPITNSQTFTNTNPKLIDVYTVRFQPDSLSDVLLVQYTASSVTDATNGHVGMQAVTVAAAVPEPGTAGLLFLGSLICRRRRRRE